MFDCYNQQRHQHVAPKLLLQLFINIKASAIVFMFQNQIRATIPVEMNERVTRSETDKKKFLLTFHDYINSTFYKHHISVSKF